MSGLQTALVLDNIVSHAMSLGLFDKVNQHEPKQTGNQGLWCAIWAQSVTPVRSGLDATSARVEFTVRIGQSMMSEPQDAIDPAMLNAVDALMGAYSGDFDAGGTARCIDLLGSDGPPLSARAGYLQMGQQVFRIFDLTVPVLINDAFDQEA